MSMLGILLMGCLGFTRACNTIEDELENYTIEDVLETLKSLDARHGELNTESTVAQWNYNTNLTDYNSEVSTNKSKILENFEADAFKIISEFDETLYEDNFDLKRQIKKVLFITHDTLPLSIIVFVVYSLIAW